MDIKASEITSILKQQIKDFDNKSEVSEIGQVLSVGDGIARIYGLDNVQAVRWLNSPVEFVAWHLTLKKTMSGL